jgi:triosephosphate isomerase
MRKKILAANWKMNLTAAEAHLWIEQFSKDVAVKTEVEWRLYAPSVFIPLLSDSPHLHVGAQNVHPKRKGAFTGEISIPQLKSVGAKSVLIGHSERRSFFHETDEFIRQKVAACVESAFSFVLCCGENLDTRNSGNHLAFIRAQIAPVLQEITMEQIALLTIAYEPIWAIGSGQSAESDQISEVHALIRGILVDIFGQPGYDVPILYGGSVNSENAQAIFSCSNVDGGLIGGASLQAKQFLQLASSIQ